MMKKYSSGKLRSLFFSLFFLSLPLIFHIAMVVVFGFIGIDVELVSFIATLTSGLIVLGIAKWFGVLQISFDRNVDYVKLFKFILLTLLLFAITRLIYDLNYLDSLIERGLIFPNLDRSVYYLIGVLIMAPLFEELIFRGIGTEYLINNNFSNVATVLTISTVLSIGHLPGLNIFFTNFILAVFLNITYLKERNLMYCILIHFSYNLLSLLFD